MDRRLKGLDECRPGELFERRASGELDVFDRTGRGPLNPPRPLVGEGANRSPDGRRSEPLTRSTVLIVLAAALCAGLAAGLAG